MQETVSASTSAGAAQPLAAGPNPGLVFSLLNAYQQSAALKAAIELDVFRAVGEGPGDVASIAKHCSASERGVRILCDFLVMSELLEKHGESYKHTPTSAVFLDSRSPASMGSVARFMNDPGIHALFGDLANIVRHGRTVMPGEGMVEPENPMWVEFARSMVPMMGPSAGPMAELVLEGLADSDGHSEPMKVLDIAAGHGLFGIAIATRNPEAEITALDWAAVLEVAHENACAAGVDGRYTKMPGSAFEAEFGGPYDAVLLTNFLHHFDRATCVDLLKKVHAALKPGGKVAALEFVPNEDRVSPGPAARFSMTMLATTVAGNAYTLSELRSMYEEAGFGGVTGHPLMGPQTVVMGRA
jgi:2-polyprenyl-3-methyl-5-hydroxy-6-metoxy-1,4-benzoquinol methylase